MNAADVTALARQREQSWKTLREVQSDIGVSIAYLSELERGIRNDPSLSMARKLADYYGVTVDQLFPRDEVARIAA